jgi:DNA-binding NarL/FixJ family response regulator
MLRRLRRRHGRVDWILSWDQPSSKWLAVLLDSRAKGFLRPGSGVEFERALEAVLKGELWFPRSVSQWLYRSLLDASRAGDADADAGRDAELTSRESEVMALMRQGLTNKQIGLHLGISVNTVKKHVGHAFDKRGLHSRRQALT